MSRTSSANGPKMTVYDVITDRIIGKLEEGVVPWHMPWKAADAARNAVTDHRYRGINVLMLALFGTGYESPFWLTFKQAQSYGGSIRKGEHGVPIVYWKKDFRWPDDKRCADCGRIGCKHRQRFIQRYSTVFNVEQTEDCTFPARVKDWKANLGPEVDPIEVAEAIVAGMPNPPSIAYDGSGRAFYRPAEDGIHLPLRVSFDGSEEFYSTLFHEITHSTGHASRVGRQGVEGFDHFGSDRYASEELVAEIGNAFLCGEAGIADQTLDNSAAYVSSWLGRLKGDKELVVHAASAAQKAADYVLNRVAGEVQKDPAEPLQKDPAEPELVAA